MPVSLNAAAAAAAEASPDKYRPEPDPERWEVNYNGDALVAAARSAVAEVARPYRISKYERDALVSEVVCRVLAAKKTERGASGREHMRLIARGLIRDDRSWRDVAGDQRKRERSKPRPAAPGIAPEVEREAERHAHYVEERREVSFSDLADGGDYLLHALDRERAAIGEEAPQVAANAEEVAESVAATLREAGTITERERPAVLVALLMAHGVKLSAVARENGYSIATAWRRSASGVEILKERVAPGDLLDLCDRATLALALAADQPDAHAALLWAAARAVDSVRESACKQTACYLAGGGSEPHGPRIAPAVARRYRSHRAATAHGWHGPSMAAEPARVASGPVPVWNGPADPAPEPAREPVPALPADPGGQVACPACGEPMPEVRTHPLLAPATGSRCARCSTLDHAAKRAAVAK